MLNVQTGFLDVPGTRLYYEVAGVGDPIVFVHGLNVNCSMWDAQFAEFARDHRVIRFDMRGFGKTDMTEEPFTNYGDMVALFDHLGVDKAVIVGLSFGGYSSLEFALAHPERVRGMVLLASGLFGRPMSEARKRALEEMNEVKLTRDLDKIIELNVNQWLNGPGQPADRTSPVVQEHFKRMLRHTFTKEQVNNVPTFLDPPVKDRLHELNVPTLAIAGELDFPDYAEIARLLAEHNRQAKALILPNVAHMINMEAPHKVNALIREFLLQLPSKE